MKLIKRKVSPAGENAVILEYIEWTQEFEDICDYLEGRKRQITGYGENKEAYQIKLDEILYFEAVGSLCFAYTKTQIYEVKMRLYQIEEMVRPNRIVRASKSFLINIRKIENVRPALNGRFVATMDNGEEVLISRQYAKEVADAIKAA
ncbi:MAG: LytTR family DNA-binding domain-containing protein [Thermoflexaceae bacterium]|nr:LytTR family DNA-binding domain-containing protein [Thermoflexaceae bacterium]